MGILERKIGTVCLACVSVVTVLGGYFGDGNRSPRPRLKTMSPTVINMRDEQPAVSFLLNNPGRNPIRISTSDDHNVYGKIC